MGTPLKNWDINIYRGVLTGCNEAFIIDGKKKAEIIASDPKSAEIIRPILRGRDIKRYSYEFAELYIIATFPSLKIDIEAYPAVKQHLLSFGHDRLKQTGEIGARKKTNNKWFETQDSISYWEDFYKQKIVWGNLNLKASYTFADAGVYINAPCPLIVPASKYLLAVLNSKLADYYIRSLGVTRNGGYFEYKPMFVEKLPVPVITKEKKDLIEDRITKIIDVNYNSSKEEEEEIIDSYIYDLYDLNQEEIAFIKHSEA